MRYSSGAVSFLSTVFTFRATSLVVAVDIFDPIDNEADVVDALAPNDKHKERLSRWFKEHHVIDAGILVAAADAAASGIIPSSWIAPSVVSTCTEYVKCKDGSLDDGIGGTTCFVACGGKCCTYTDSEGYVNNACIGFTGKVCKDGSCTGDQACALATIPSVVNSCLGEDACRGAGYGGGSIIKIVDSCNGFKACEYIGRYSGSIGSITGSCIGEFACHGTASAYGKVGNILNSCNGSDNCHYIGSYFGSIGSITGSCNGNYVACANLGRYGGAVGDLNNACTAVFACVAGAVAGGTIASITNSCTAGYSCLGLGRVDGNVGHVKDSCTAPYSCRDTAFGRGSIGTISTSCKALDACKRAGSGPTGPIKSDLSGCCNEVSFCESATEKTLPVQCNSKAAKTRARKMN